MRKPNFYVNYFKYRATGLIKAINTKLIDIYKRNKVLMT